MTPSERDIPEKSEDLASTEFSFAFAVDAERAVDNTLPDVPAMELLPNQDALPDPGFPEMPPPATVPSVADHPLSGPTDGPEAESWPHPPVWPPGFPTFTPAPSFTPADPTAPLAPTGPQAAVQPEARKPVWSADPYAAPRAPDDAPPLHGPSVPWSEVRAAADHEAAGETLAAPPTLPSHAAAPPQHAAAPPAYPPEAAHPVQSPHLESHPVQPSHVEPTWRPTSEMLTSDLLLSGKRATPDAGWRRTLYRATGGLVHVGESSATMRHRDLLNRIRTPVPGGHQRIAVLSLKGGVGKTTVTVGLGSTLASLRGDRVIAVDGNPDRGTLSDKVRLETPATIRDLLNERTRVGRYADVRAFTSQMPSRLEILASDRDPAVSEAFSAEDYRGVVGVLEHYYSICITDCGTGLLHSAMAGILELADQIVLVSSPAVDGARSASATLDWLEAHRYGDLVRGGVVALSAVRRKSKSAIDLDRLEQHFATRCRAVVRIPYDPHLEEGAEFELDYLDPETADAYLTLSALVADYFARPG